MSRKDLLLLATNRFCQAEDHNRLSIDQYKEAFYLLIGAVDQQTKQRVSHLVSYCPYTPRAIALYLALENLSVSSPILINSKVLGQLDLMRIVEMKGENHAALIARRDDVGTSLLQKLKSFDDEEIKSVLDANSSQSDGEPREEVGKLFERIAETTRQEPKNRSALNSAESALLKAAARGGKLPSQSEKPVPANLPILDFGKTFERAAATRSHQGMVMLMQKQSGLHPKTGHQILADKSGDTLAVFLRALNVDDAQANRIQLLVQPAIGLSVKNASRAIKFYTLLQTDTCILAVDQWPKIKGHSIEHQSYLMDGQHSHRNTERTTRSITQSGNEQLQQTA
ncbi:MAG: hypothetical protein V3V04_07090 [Rhizobiaceae bacterium]